MVKPLFPYLIRYDKVFLSQFEYGFLYVRLQLVIDKPAIKPSTSDPRFPSTSIPLSHRNYSPLSLAYDSEAATRPGESSQDVKPGPFLTPGLEIVSFQRLYDFVLTISRIASPNGRDHPQAQRSRRSLSVWSLFPPRGLWPPERAKGCAVYDRAARRPYHILVNGSFFTHLVSNEC